MDKQQLRKEILTCIQQPRIPQKTVNAGVLGI